MTLFEENQDILLLLMNQPITPVEHDILLKRMVLFGKRNSYSLTGWDWNSCQHKKDDAQVNDPLFLKNKVYKSTQLRLYVRKKLAVEDFMPYLKNTQAFSNYIEGEINFDVLDDNSLEILRHLIDRGLLKMMNVLPC